MRFALGAGAVSWAFSEVGFWAHFRADDNPVGWVLSWLLYSCATYVVMRIVRRYGVRTPAAVLLVGALYGWLVEGTLANTVYLSLPFSLVWTAVAWHALITVGVGWFALPAALRRGGPSAVGWCALLGLAWGLWNVGWWGVKPDEGQPVAASHPASYAVFLVLVTAAVAVGYATQDRFPPGPPRRRSLVAVGGVLVLWSVPAVLIPIPWAPLVLGPLVWLAITGLRRLGTPAAFVPTHTLRADSHTSCRLDGVSAGRLAPLAAVPVTAWLSALLASPLSGQATGRGPAYVGFVAAIATLSITGTLALAWAVRRAWTAGAH